MPKRTRHNQTYRRKLTRYQLKQRNINLSILCSLPLFALFMSLIFPAPTSYQQTLLANKLSEPINEEPNYKPINEEPNYKPINEEPNHRPINSATPTTTPETITIIPIQKEWIEPIENAAIEFNVPALLIYGIANAESGLGKYFYNPYDKDNCFNLWGLKGGKTPERIKNENSYLRCFNDYTAGARTIAKTLRLYYLDEGRTTAEAICQKWIGATHAEANCPDWIKNVKKYYPN